MPAPAVIQEGHQSDGRRVESQADEGHPQREGGARGGHDAHDHRREEDHGDLRREVPQQTPEVDDRQEYAQAQGVVHGHRPVDLHHHHQAIEKSLKLQNEIS